MVRLMTARVVSLSEIVSSAARSPFSPLISSSPISPVYLCTTQLSKSEVDVPSVKKVAFFGVLGYGVFGAWRWPRIAY